MASAFTPTDFEKIATALARKADGIAGRLKESLKEDKPNEHQAELFLQLLDVLKARREAQITSKLNNHDLLGAYILRGTTGPVAVVDITSTGDVPDMPPPESK